MALKCIGIDRTEEELEGLGEDIFRKKYELKKKYGFRFEDIFLPKRFFETATTTEERSKKKGLEKQLECTERRGDLRSYGRLDI